MNIAVLGASGFVGSAVVGAVEAAGRIPRPLTAPRIDLLPERGAAGVLAAANQWEQNNHGEFIRLCEEFRNSDAVINTAGLATPDAPWSSALFGANSVLPVVLQHAAEQSGTRKFVHVSSAAVQGRRPILDEAATYDLISPYAESKALGELALTFDNPPGTVIYRATSVMGSDRGITRQLLRLAALPVIPVPGRGDQPLPLAHISNTADAIVFAATSSVSGITVHPWEGLTVRRMLELFGARRLVSTPKSLWETGIEALFVGTPNISVMAALGKRLDLLVSGQRSTVSSLTSAGFQLRVLDEGYVALTTRDKSGSNGRDSR